MGLSDGGEVKPTKSCISHQDEEVCVQGCAQPKQVLLGQGTRLEKGKIKIDKVKLRRLTFKTLIFIC